MKKYPVQKISSIPILLKVRGISTFKHKSGEFALVTLYIAGFSRDGTDIYTCVKCKLYLVEGLKVNMLIGNNLLYTEGFSINLASTFTYI